MIWSRRWLEPGSCGLSGRDWSSRSVRPLPKAVPVPQLQEPRLDVGRCELRYLFVTVRPAFQHEPMPAMNVDRIALSKKFAQRLTALNI